MMEWNWKRVNVSVHVCVRQRGWDSCSVTVEKKVMLFPLPEGWTPEYDCARVCVCIWVCERSYPGAKTLYLDRCLCLMCFTVMSSSRDSIPLTSVGWAELSKLQENCMCNRNTEEWRSSKGICDRCGRLSGIIMTRPSRPATNVHLQVQCWVNWSVCSQRYVRYVTQITIKAKNINLIDIPFFFFNR